VTAKKVAGWQEIEL